MKIRKLLRVTHRDFGYFIVGMTIIYALSGIYLNHRHDFNPDYKIYGYEFESDFHSRTELTKNEILEVFNLFEHNLVYKKHYINNEGNVKVFIENGEMTIDPGTGKGTLHYLQKRPLIFGMNKLHRATLGTVWKWGSDIMAAIMIFVAISGLFLLKGKRSFGNYGWWYTVAGILIPLIFAILFV